MSTVASILISVIAAGTGAVWYRQRQPAAAIAALANEYSQRRRFEARIPAARYSDLLIMRGGETGMERSPAFLETLAGIRRNLSASAVNPGWLRAKGVAELLSGNAHDAIATFRAASDLGEDSAEFWTEFGLAYFQAAERNQTADEYTIAVEFLSKAAAKRPSDPALQFDLGLAFERLKLFDSSIQSFRHCLELERETGWIREAREHMQAVEQQRARVLPPDGIRGDAADVESRLDRVFTGDLLAAQTDSSRVADLEALANELQIGHGDAWLADALPIRGLARLLSSIQSLSTLAQVRTSLRFDRYDSLDARITALQAMSLPQPLAAWRDFELLFRASHSRNLASCPDSDRLIRQLHERHYRALEIQTMLERSTCESGKNRLDAAYEHAQDGVRLAAEAGFPSMRLRGLGFVVSDYVNQGRYREAYQVSCESIDEVIRTGYLRRGHQFYNTMMRAADRLEHWYTARAAAQMARRMAGATGSAVYEMIAQCKLADFSLRVGLTREADQEYSEALTLYHRLSDTPTVAAYAATAQAGILESRADYTGLQSLLRSLPPANNPFLEAPVVIALSRLALNRGDAREALAYAKRLTDWLGEPAADADRNTFRKMMERASIVETRALLALGDDQGAYRAWYEHLSREARLMGGATVAYENRVPVPGAAVLTFADLQTGIGIWTRTPDATHFAWAGAGREEILRKIRKLRRLCSDPSSPMDELRNIETSLWKTLFDPALTKVRGVTEVKIEASGELNSVPVMLLFGDFAPGLVARGVRYTPLPLAVRQPAAGRPLLVGASIAHPDLTSTLPPLAGLKQEIAQLAAMLPAAETLAGSQATPAALDRAVATARIVHFAGHAVYWREGMALVVAPDASDSRADARMGIWKITPSTHIGADLVVLSACSTAALQESETVMPSRLAEAALLAGAKQVVGTLWDIDSGAANRFDTAFYRSFSQGKPVAEAFSAAIAAVRSMPGLAHPYFWAPFMLFESNSGD